jgi:hypothetical protein
MPRLAQAGLERGAVAAWPDTALPLANGFRNAWRAAWHENPELYVVQLLHPSAQNMSPFAGSETLFHRRMVETRDALCAAVEQVLDLPPRVPRPSLPTTGGIYDLPEWRDRIAPRHRQLDQLWRERGV